MNRDSQFPSSTFEDQRTVLAEDATTPPELFWSIVKQDVAVYTLVVLISIMVGFCFGVASVS